VVAGKLEKQVAAIAAVNYDPWVVVHSNAFRYDSVTKRRSFGYYQLLKALINIQAFLNRPHPTLSDDVGFKIAWRK
jgi:hypothetical protein